MKKQSKKKSAPRRNKTERELEHLEGYGGIGLVRIGNAAHEQLQLDIYGEVVLAAYCYVTLGGRLDRYERKLVAGFGQVVRKLWRCPDHSITSCT